MDKRVFAFGLAMLAVGIISWYYFKTNEPLSNPNMSEPGNPPPQEEITNLGLQELTGLIAGLGFFITLISLGLKRRNKGGVGKPITQKPKEI